jgi:purine-cytosine permease-like protein
LEIALWEGIKLSEGKKHYFDDPKNVWRVIKTFFVICVLLLIADFFIPKHGVYYWEDIPEFYAAYGLVACILLVLGAKYILRMLVKRDEDYYD